MVNDFPTFFSVNCALTLLSTLAMLKASDAFPGSDPDLKIREIKAWLKSKGVRDFEPVTLFSDQIAKVSHRLDAWNHPSHSLCRIR
jgi:hypothetical protein